MTNARRAYQSLRALPAIELAKGLRPEPANDSARMAMRRAYQSLRALLAIELAKRLRPAPESELYAVLMRVFIGRPQSGDIERMCVTPVVKFTAAGSEQFHREWLARAAIEIARSMRPEPGTELYCALVRIAASQHTREDLLLWRKSHVRS